MSVRDALNQKKRLNILQDITHEEGLKVSISFCQDILEHIRGYFDDMNLEISKMKEMKSVNHIEPFIEFVMNSKKKEMLMWVDILEKMIIDFTNFEEFLGSLKCLHDELEKHIAEVIKKDGTQT